MTQRIETNIAVYGLVTGYDNINKTRFATMYFKLKNINGDYIGTLYMDSTDNHVEGINDLKQGSI